MEVAGGKGGGRVKRTDEGLEAMVEGGGEVLLCTWLLCVRDMPSSNCV